VLVLSLVALSLVTVSAGLAISRRLRCGALSVLEAHVYCAPGDPSRFDPIGSVRDVAKAVGIGQFALVVALEATGTWTNGTVDARKPDTRVEYVFRDGVGTRYAVSVHDGMSRVTSGQHLADQLEWADDPTCTGGEMWNSMRSVLERAPTTGSVVFREGRLEWRFPSPDGSAWTAKSVGWCGRPDGGHERDFTGCYVATLHAHVGRAANALALVITTSGEQVAAPYLEDVPPVLKRAVEDQVAPDLLETNQVYTCMGGGVMPRNIGVRVALSGRGRFARGRKFWWRDARDYVEFLEVHAVRPATREECPEVPVALAHERDEHDGRPSPVPSPSIGARR
jgi:hypothetical protein